MIIKILLSVLFFIVITLILFFIFSVFIPAIEEKEFTNSDLMFAKSEESETPDADNVEKDGKEKLRKYVIRL